MILYFRHFEDIYDDWTIYQDASMICFYLKKKGFSTAIDAYACN